jgi:hypothetical protein
MLSENVTLHRSRVADAELNSTIIITPVVMPIVGRLLSDSSLRAPITLARLLKSLW